MVTVVSLPFELRFKQPDLKTLRRKDQRSQFYLLNQLFSYLGSFLKSLIKSYRNIHSSLPAMPDYLIMQPFLLPDWKSVVSQSQRSFELTVLNVFVFIVLRFLFI